MRRFTAEIYEKTGYKIGWYWQICWMVISPLVLLIILIFSLYSFLTTFNYSRYITNHFVAVYRLDRLENQASSLPFDKHLFKLTEIYTGWLLIPLYY